MLWWVTQTLISLLLSVNSSQHDGVHGRRCRRSICFLLSSESICGDAETKALFSQAFFIRPALSVSQLTLTLKPLSRPAKGPVFTSSVELLVRVGDYLLVTLVRYFKYNNNYRDCAS